MSRTNRITFYCCLCVTMAVGCVSPRSHWPLLSRDKLAQPMSDGFANEEHANTANKPVVRSQNNSTWGGTVATSDLDAPRQPMPVSGQVAQPIGTTPDASYNAPAQFGNPAASQANWSNSAAPTSPSVWSQNSAGLRPPPPTGYPSYPATPNYGTTQQLPPPTAQQPPRRPQPSPSGYQPLLNNTTGAAPGTPAGPRAVAPPTRSPQPSATFTSSDAPGNVPIIEAPGQSGNTDSNGDWQPTVPYLSQSPAAVSSPVDPPGVLPQPPFGASPPSAPVTPGAPITSGQPLNYGTAPSGPTDGSPLTTGWPQEFGPPQVPAPPGDIITPSARFADVLVNVQETQTGRFMLGAAVNSDAGLTGQIVIDEQNFDWRRWPTSVDDLFSGKSFRGGGQRLRIEALPGDEVQRYMIQFSEPYLAGTRISFNLSGYLFDRRYFDWDENRLGGRAGLGYRITPDLSIAGGIRAERVKITDPRVGTGVVPELDDVLGESELYSGNISLTQDTRDIPFAPTQGYYLRFSYDQIFGSFDYGRGEIDWRRYLLVTERPDGSGRHVLGFSNRFALSGDETPIFENYFAGGHATLRGFEFRGASPEINTVTVGGRMMFLGSVEYLFPVTADDMLKAVVFCDYGTVEEDTDIDWDDFRVALGAGLRVAIPAMGPAPIALDFAVPINREDTDDIQNFSFFVGYSR